MNSNHNLAEVAIDAAIAGGAAVTGLMAGTAFGAVRADPIAFVYAAATAFFVAFFAGLQAARGRKAAPEEIPLETP